MQRVLILTAGFGEGHNSAARNIAAGLAAVAPGTVATRVADLFPACYGPLYDAARGIYGRLIGGATGAWAGCYRLLDRTPILDASLEAFAPVRMALATTLLEMRPTVVVATYPLYPFLWDQLGTDGTDHPFFRVIMVTDSLSINSTWYRPRADAWIAPNEGTARVLVAAGLPADAVHVLGFPVDPRFALLAGTAAPPPTGLADLRVLLMFNRARPDALDIVRALLALPGLRVTVAVARGAPLRRQVEDLVAGHLPAVEVLGWTDRIPELFLAHHLVIGKAGGATVQEAIAARLPIVIDHVVPGQEEGNARLIIDHDCGCVARTPEEIAAAVRRAGDDGAAVWRRWRHNIGDISRPAAACDIARFLIARGGRAAVDRPEPSGL